MLRSAGCGHPRAVIRSTSAILRLSRGYLVIYTNKSKVSITLKVFAYTSVLRFCSNGGAELSSQVWYHA